MWYKTYFSTTMKFDFRAETSHDIWALQLVHYFFRKKKKKKMLRIFFQILQVADEAYFNKIRCRCVFVLSSLVRTCKSHVQKDAGWCWSLSFSCRNDGWFEAEKDRPCPRKSVQWLPNICVQTFCWLFQSHGVAGGCSQADKTWLPFHYNTVTL